MSDLGWDLPAKGSTSFAYDPFAPQSAPAPAPRPAPAPADLAPAPQAAAAPTEVTTSVAASALSGWLPVAAMPVLFLALRLGLTPLLGLTVLSAPWLVVGALAMIVLALLLTRALGPEAIWLGLLLAVLAAMAETLLVLAPVCLLTALVTARLTQAR